MRILQPVSSLNSQESQKALKLVIHDGIFSEAMVTLTTGTFLTALALQLGADNFQIGLLASIPTLANLFPFAAIWLLKKLPNRRFLTVILTVLARLPLFVIGLAPFFFEHGKALLMMIPMFFIHQSLAAISGTIWTTWMKDLVPHEKLGSYFSRRSKIITFSSLAVSLVIAAGLDFIKTGMPAYELYSYSTLFILGGVIGLTGVILLSKTPEPAMAPLKMNVTRSFIEPIKQKNYRNLLIYQSVWTFATNLAVPFYTVYQLTLLKIPVSLVILFSIVNQLAVALFVKIWGMYTDKFSNKAILQICSPVYLLCILGWTYTSMPAAHHLTLAMVALLQFTSGAAFAGINLALTNISIKLAPKENTVSFISAKSMIVAMISGLAPIVAGSMSKVTESMNTGIRFSVGNYHFSMIEIQNWDIFFILAVIAGSASLLLLKNVSEEGEKSHKKALKNLYRKMRYDVNPKKNVRTVIRKLEERKIRRAA